MRIVTKVDTNNHSSIMIRKVTLGAVLIGVDLTEVRLDYQDSVDLLAMTDGQRLAWVNGVATQLGRDPVEEL